VGKVPDLRHRADEFPGSHVSNVMRKFTFPLARVIDWRQTQLRIEESSLARLHAELRGIETCLAEMRAAREQSENAILTAGSVTGAELRDFDAFKKASKVEFEKLTKAAADSRKRIATQIEVLSRKRRDLRLLENLRHRKLDAWRADLEREIDNEATELYLASIASRGWIDQSQRRK
jgi:flagellar export protein FliJ